MTNKNKLIVALMLAGISAQVMPADAYAAEADLLTDVYETEESELEQGVDYKDIADVVNKQNEKDVRESDGTDKFNRATETNRTTYGEDKNVTNIDPEVTKKLEETNGEYGKKDGAYANHNLKSITTPIKNIVVNQGKNQNEVAVTWFAAGDVNANSKLVFDGIEYKPVRSRKTGDKNGYSTYTAVVNITPGKTYNYYVQTGDNKSATMTLTTKALGKDNEFNIAYIGDPQIGSGDKVWDSKGLNKNTQAKVDQDKIDFNKSVKKAREINPNFYMSMGDNVEVVNYEGEYDYFLDNDLFKERVFVTVMGNHETYVDDKGSNKANTVFSDHFYLPNESKYGSKEMKNDDGTDTYLSGDYYFTYGDVLFLNLNSNEKDNKAHEAFIKEAIAKATKERGSNFSWKVVSMHHSPYSTATHSSDDDIFERRQQLVPIFNENGIDLVLTGHDHIYTRSKHMLAGELALPFDEAYGTDIAHKGAKVKDGKTETFNNKVYSNGKVIVDGIGLDYEGDTVTNPRGTLFLTMSASGGAKFYNPISEDSWYVNKSLDDRSQLFADIKFSKNEFKIVAMDPNGVVVDTYTVRKTDDFIANPAMNNKAVDKSKLASYIADVEKMVPVSTKENVNIYNQAIAQAKNVLVYNMSNQEEVDAAIEVLRTRLTEVEFAANNAKKSDAKADKKTAKAEVKAPKAAVKAEANKEAAAENVQTGVGSLMGVGAMLTTAVAGLFTSKRK